jgi:hypothetical protein
MGLDVVELVMELEDEFGLSISDEVAEKLLVSVGTTIDLVLAELRRRDGEAGVCATARSFYRLRRGLVRDCEVRHADVRLDVAIGELLPRRQQRRAWQRVAGSAGLRGVESWTPFRAPFPPQEMSVRDLLKTRVMPTYRRFDGSLDEDEVTRRVFEIVAEKAGLPVDRVHRESRYIEDLEMG